MKLSPVMCIHFIDGEMFILQSPSAPAVNINQQSMNSFFLQFVNNIDTSEWNQSSPINTIDSLQLKNE